MPNVINDTEDDLDYVMSDGVIRPPESVILSARLPPESKLFVDAEALPDKVNHQIFSTRPATDERKILAELSEVDKSADVRIGYRIALA